MTPSYESYPNGWHIQWETLKGATVVARRINSRQSRTREWHLVPCGRLRDAGISTPVHRKDSWEVDWSIRCGKRVWGRNLLSKMPRARLWHWIDFHTIQNAGMAWRPATTSTGRYKDKKGYITLTRRGMTSDDEAIAEQYGLLRGKRKTFTKEHQLVAVKKYKRSLDGLVVRHINGIKDDNRPENIVIGTSAENTMDHNSARISAMYWRCKYDEIAEMVHSGYAIDTIMEAINGPKTATEGASQPATM